MFVIRYTIIAFFLAAPIAVAEQTLEPEAPKIAPASDEGQRALAGFKIPRGIEGGLFAAEPLLANPVAFYIDNQGKVYVCETFRQKKGVEDNRGHSEWLDDDLAARSVEDRLAYIKRHLKDEAIEYMRHDDRIRLVVDEDGDGKADSATVFADHFNKITAGTGAGVLAYKGNVYYTCIPDLWLLKDTDGDGKSDSRKSLHYGYGVRFAFRGHDMHGLTIGPDGRLYFSIGDRGYNVEADGKRHANPESGAVFRCELDGSKLEVFATGLRNPQELVFDDYGNLFTGDNNSDSGDKARWVYVVEGGDSGWRMAYQYLPDRGPFNREKLWHPYHEGQPAYIVPPIANIADGPSGLTYYPGTGFGDDFKGRFFLCDFRGQASRSGVRSFRVKQKGAFFELVDEDQPFWNILATDVDFGPDGAIYMTDWVHGWDGLGKGRIYRFVDADKKDDPLRLEVQKLLATGLVDQSDDELVKLLSHADRRIRQEGQFTLVDRNKVEALKTVALNTELDLARLHAIWGLGQVGRHGRIADSSTLLRELLTDDDDEVRAHAATLAAEIDNAFVADQLIANLKDDKARVRYFAAMSLGKLEVADAVDPLLEMLVADKNEDPIVRHGGIMGLVGAADSDTLAEAARHRSPAARIGVLVAMRKRNDANVAVFLKDADPRLVVEAARAIHDAPIKEAMPQLADLISTSSQDEPLLRRVLNANFRLGTQEHANAIAGFAARKDVPENMRSEALQMLASWEAPSGRDRVLGMWRPLANGDKSVAANAVRRNLAGILAASEQAAHEGGRVAAGLGVKEVAPTLRKLALDDKQKAAVRADALRALTQLNDDNLAHVVAQTKDDKRAIVRAAALDALVSYASPAAAAAALKRAVFEGELMERQAALATLSGLKNDHAAGVVAAAFVALTKGKIPDDTKLDVLEAARNHPQKPIGLIRVMEWYEESRPKDDPLSEYRETLAGGSAEHGKTIFFEKREVSCVRCHKIGETGGDVGPDLSKFAADKTREYLLEAVVLPSKTIAKNFDSVVVQTEEGLTHTGIVREEDDDILRIVTADGEIITIDQELIVARKAGQSAMPADLSMYLTKRELRDLVEYLSTLK